MIMPKHKVYDVNTYMHNISASNNSFYQKSLEMLLVSPSYANRVVTVGYVAVGGSVMHILRIERRRVKSTKNGPLYVHPSMCKDSDWVLGSAISKCRVIYHPISSWSSEA